MYSPIIKGIGKLVEVPEQQKLHEQNLIRSDIFAQETCLSQRLAPDQAKNRPEDILTGKLMFDKTTQALSRTAGANAQVSSAILSILPCSLM